MRDEPVTLPAQDRLLLIGVCDPLQHALQWASRMLVITSTLPPQFCLRVEAQNGLRHWGSHGLSD